MGIATDIKTLGEDIVASYDTRVKGEKDRLKEFKSMWTELVSNNHKMLEGFRIEHKEMADKLRADLVKGEEERLNEFKPWWSNIEKEVHDLLEKFAKEHAAMAYELRKALAKGETERLKEFKPWWSNIEKEVHDLLEKFVKEHAAMAAELKKALAKGETERLNEFKPWWSSIQKEVLDRLQEFKAEREKMAANWQAITATMAKKRGIMPEVEAEVKVRPVKEAIEEVEVDLEEKVLEFINQHPEGVKVGDMEEPLGVTRTSLGKIAKKLLDEGKVRKEENLYFPL
ncbi:MAG: hypothetical protein KJ666_10005 [Bacteroidetes bacterium]|nr:hypothetical protein [Bacteroidota bacterium]